jgi:predicted tellurium resistance membrane protein TerC
MLDTIWLDFQQVFTTAGFIALLTLLTLEIVLGIDNIIFITILSDKLKDDEKPKARQWGIALAVISRIVLLFAISYIMDLKEYILFWDLSAKDLVLIVGGFFLIGKSTYEIHEKLEAHEMSGERKASAPATLTGVIAQIILIDMVFSLDSVITAVGITQVRSVMVLAILSAAGVMLFFAGAVSDFVKRHPTMKILALALLILIGTVLVIEGWAHEMAEDLHIKNYVYVAMAFAFFVEMLNVQMRKNQPVELHNQPVIKGDKVK